ncbi:MAG: hypothetical protein HOM58_20180 [Rhodospirillaceae bacterium]|nr:hypothetical protein [Rhodospirillaceae bacterium]
MYQDNSLLPREAVRLAALGTLAETPMTYAALAADVRNFASRVAGPSLELMGTSIEMLRYEGLVRPLDGAEDGGAEAELTLTDDGRTELLELLRAHLRPPLSDVNKLIVALKFRFLHLLPEDDQQTQLAMMTESCETDLARLVDLRGQYSDYPGHLIAWLDQEIGIVEDRLEWLRGFLPGQNVKD